MRKPIVNQPVLGENESSGSGASNTIPALTTPAAKDSDDMADTESTSGKPPAFQFYPSDFVTGTITLTTEEIGAYILLLCHCWDRGFIPSDLRLLARIARLSLGRMKLAWAVLVHKFIAIDGGYIQPRLERERQKQAEFRQRQSENGRRGGRPRKPTESQAKGLGYSGLTQTETQTEAKKSSSVFGLQSSDFSQRDTESVSLTRTDPVGSFVDWYSEAHERYVGVGYIGNPQKDYQSAIQLCKTFNEQELRDAVLVWFGMDDDFATSGTRTIPKFASRASKCVQLARKVSV